MSGGESEGLSFDRVGCRHFSVASFVVRERKSYTNRAGCSHFSEASYVVRGVVLRPQIG